MEKQEIKIGNILYCQQAGFVEVVKEPYFFNPIGWEVDVKDEEGYELTIPVFCLSKKLTIPKEYKDLVEFI